MTRRTLRIPTTNLLNDGNYAGRLYLGAQRREVNLLIDTGSSTFAVDHRSYDPRADRDAEVTRFAQQVDYADGSGWIGSVVRTSVRVQRGAAGDTVGRIDVAVAYRS